MSFKNVFFKIYLNLSQSLSNLHIYFYELLKYIIEKKIYQKKVKKQYKNYTNFYIRFFYEYLYINKYIFFLLKLSKKLILIFN